jgi:hypothetical protein
MGGLRIIITLIITVNTILFCLVQQLIKYKKYINRQPTFAKGSVGKTEKNGNTCSDNARLPAQ